MASVKTAFTALFLFFFSLTVAADNTSGVFVYEASSTYQYVYALSVDTTSNDLYIYLSAPNANAWVAFGFGEKMKDSLVFVAYTSANGSAVTLSPRLGGDHVEPSYASQVDCQVLSPGTTVDNNANLMYGHWKCKNAIAAGKLSVGKAANNRQPFIFALGPGAFAMNSDDLEAPMRKHQFYGHFTMDMAKASGPNATFPQPNGPNNSWNPQNASPAFDTNSSSNRAAIAHAILMCAAFVLIFPFGSLVLRLKNLVIPHLIVQAGGVLFVIVGAGLGIHISKQYNRSKHYQSPHQIIGLTLFAVLFAQIGLGLVGHHQNKEAKKRTPLSLVHFILGPSIILFGIINGGLGFTLAGNPWRIFQYYIVIVVAVTLLFSAARATCYCLARRRRNSERPAEPEESGYQYPEYGSAMQPMLGAAEGVPMQPFFPGPPGRKDNLVITTTRVR